MLLIILLVLLFLALGGGWRGYDTYGYRGFGPLGLLVIVLLIAWFVGAFN